MTSVATSTSGFYERSLAQMDTLRGSLQELQSQIATGQRIERGSDDPVGAARLRTLSRAERLGEVEQENAARLGQDIGAASREVEGVLNLLQRVRELAVAGASDTLGEDGREAIALELGQIGEELFARANATNFTGQPLFAGTAGAPAFTQGTGGTVTYNGNSENAAVPIAPGTEIERGVTGDQVFEFDVNGTPTSAFAVVSGLAAALSPGAPNPATAAQDALVGIDAAIDTANRNQTVLGTRLAWVEVIQQSQNERSIDIAEQRSEVGDTDIAEAITRLQQTLTVLEASQSSFARVSSLNLFNAL